MADVLIVDDDVDAADILADVLRSDGHEVRMAQDGQQGLSALHFKRPDVVILDVEMPVLTGPEMAHLMFLRDLGLQEVPIVLCSGVLELDSIATIVGTPYFLAKPYRLEALTELLGRALAERTPPNPQLKAAYL
jgi:DNA-binding NtrC family response regulator